MTFGKTIKTLRLGAGMTQERMAELLSISAQAISRWETDAAMPDISLLRPLANLFGVTIDHLLGMDAYKKDLQKAEFNEAYHEYWNSGDKEKNYEVARRAFAEYPGCMEYAEWLADASYCMAFLRNGEERKNFLRDAVRHYEIVLKDTANSKLCKQAIHGLVLSCCALGDKEKARTYAMREENEERRDELLCWCLEGEERVKQGQKLAERHLNDLLFYLQFNGTSIAVCDAVSNILKLLFPDENYQYYANVLQYNELSKAKALCGEKRYDEAIEALFESRRYAEKMTEYAKESEYHFTGPFFYLLRGEKKKTDAKTTDVEDFISALEQSVFDSLRDREKFIELSK